MSLQWWNLWWIARQMRFLWWPLVDSNFVADAVVKCVMACKAVEVLVVKSVVECKSVVDAVVESVVDRKAVVVAVLNIDDGCQPPDKIV